MTYSVPDLRAYLRGAWTVERTMLDRSTGARGTFTGVVAFSPLMDDGGALLQREEGTVRWGTHVGPASREYVWRETSPRSSMNVFFPDGRFFHTVNLGPSPSAKPDWRAQHWCDPDTYRVTYTAVGADELHYEWDVTGPAKDLVLATTLRRRVP